MATKEKAKFVKTDLNLYPNYPENTALVSLHILRGSYRVSIWGEDDMGYEMETPSLMKAKEIYKEITFVNNNTLKKFGFELA